MKVVQVAVFTVVWIFVVFLIFQIGNLIIFQYVAPTMLSLANSTSLVNYAQYKSRTDVVVSSYYVAMFILLITPFIYIFVRLLLKKEPSQQPIYYGGMGGGF